MELKHKDPKNLNSLGSLIDFIGLNLKEQTLRVKYGNGWLPTIRDVYPEQIRKI